LEDPKVPEVQGSSDLPDTKGVYGIVLVCVEEAMQCLVFSMLDPFYLKFSQLNSTRIHMVLMLLLEQNDNLMNGTVID
jgi:hypothetical protein